MSEKEIASKISAEDYEEKKKTVRKSIIKFGILALLAFIIFIFATISWFSMNHTASTDGMGLRVGTNGFELEVDDGNIGYSELYEKVSPDALSVNENLRTSAEKDTIQWRISGSDDKLKPGEQGELSFTIISNGSDVSDLKYSLDIGCYSADTEISEGIEVINSLDLIDQNTASQDKKDGDKYFRSHIMFFTSRTGSTKEDFQYSGLIEDISDFTLTPDEDNKAVIYWIWPNTLGQIVLDSSQTTDQTYLGTGAVSVLNSTGISADRSKLISRLKEKENNKYNIFKGNEDYSKLLDDLNTKRSSGTSYNSEYEKLSKGYNAADQVIGKNVNYVSVLLNASSN